MTLALRWLTLASLLGVAAIASAQKPQYSGVDQRRLSFLTDPDLFYVRPGNDGIAIFEGGDEGLRGNLQPWQDEYCDARELVLDSRTYKLRPVDDETSVTELYWSRFGEYMKGCAMEGLLPCWVVTEDFVESWRQKPELVDRYTSEALLLWEGFQIAPLVVFDLEDWGPDADRVYGEFAAGMNGQPLGVKVSAENFHRVRGRRWDCVIADEEVVPEHYRGQAAVRWLHGQFGDIPVFISPQRPDFLRDVVWATGGVAGLWYRPLPEGPGKENERAAVHLRASGVFLQRFGIEGVGLAGRPVSREFIGNFVAEGRDWAGILRAGEKEVTVKTPDWMSGKAVGGVWYNPATDENILEPLTTATRTMTLTPPTDAMWIYSRQVSALRPDTDTTVTAIKAWPD